MLPKRLSQLLARQGVMLNNRHRQTPLVKADVKSYLLCKYTSMCQRVQSRYKDYIASTDAIQRGNIIDHVPRRCNYINPKGMPFVL